MPLIAEHPVRRRFRMPQHAREVQIPALWQDLSGLWRVMPGTDTWWQVAPYARVGAILQSDSLSQPAHASLVGGAPAAPMSHGVWGISFDGSTQYASTGVQLLRGATPSYSFFCWIERATGAVQSLMAQFTTGGVQRCDLRIHTTGALVFTKNGSTLATGTHTINDGDLHCVGMTRSRNNALTLYVDGQITATGTDNTSGYLATALTFAGTNSATQLFSGVMGLPMLWARDLGPSEVLALLRQPQGILRARRRVWQIAVQTTQTVACIAAQARWRTSAVMITTSLRMSPAQARYQAPTSVLSQPLVSNPAQAKWHAPAARLSVVLAPLGLRRLAWVKPAPPAFLEVSGPLARGLVGWWPFLEGKGDTTLAADVFSTPGTVLNKLRWGVGPHGAALESDGTASRYVRVPYRTSLGLTRDLTLTAWVRFNDPTSFLDQAIIFKGPEDGSAVGDYDLYLSLGLLSFGSFVTGNVVSTDGIGDTRWHCVAASRRGAFVTFMIDGRGAGQANLGSTVFQDNQRPLLLGSDTAGGVDGALSDVRVYNRALSDAEMAALFQMPYACLQTLGRTHRALVRRIGTPVAPAFQTVTCTPARAKWSASTPVLTQTLRCVSAQAQAQAPLAVLTQILRCVAARATYQAPAADLTQTVTCTAAQAKWQAYAARVTRTVLCTAAQAKYQVSSPVVTGGGRTIVTVAAQAQWSVVTPVETVTLRCVAARGLYQTSTPVMGRGIMCTPAQAVWQAQAPRLTQTVVCRPSQAQWHTPTPVMARLVRTTPAQGAWQTSAPVLTRALSAVAGQVAYQIVTPLTAQSILVTPAHARWQATTPSTSGGAALFVSVVPAYALYQAPASRVQLATLVPVRLGPAVVRAITEQAPHLRLRIEEQAPPLVLRLT